MKRQQILAFSHATHRLKQSASDDFDRKVLSNKVVVIENDDDVHFKLWTKRQGGMSRRQGARQDIPILKLAVTREGHVKSRGKTM